MSVVFASCCHGNIRADQLHFVPGSGAFGFLEHRVCAAAAVICTDRQADRQTAGVKKTHTENEPKKNKNKNKKNIKTALFAPQISDIKIFSS